MKRTKVYLILFILIFFDKLLAIAQPNITAKAGNIIFTLDATGNKTVTLPDVATVTSITSGSPIVTINPTNFNCTTLGPQAVMVTAVDAVLNPSAVRFSLPISLIFDTFGNLFVVDFANHKLKKISTDGIVSTFAGSGSYGISTDGNGTAASFNSPNGMAIDNKGNLYVADGSKVRKITSAGIVTTIAGQNNSGKLDGPALSASFFGLRNMVIDPDGNIFLTDGSNHSIRKISSDGIVSTIAGSGNQGSMDGKGSAASFSYPDGIARDQIGNLYVCDSYNNKIRKITPDGTVSTFAGNGVSGFKDGSAATASFDHPSNIVIDANGNFFITDYNNRIIRKITPDGIVSTFAGNRLNQNTDGIGTNASFVEVIGLTIDAAGNIFVASPYGEDIRKISPTAEVTTFAGKAYVNGDVNGSIYTSTVNYKSTLQIPVTIVSSVTITSTYNNITLPAYGPCNAIMPDYSTAATATSSCGGKIIFSQLPVAGTQLVTGSSIPVTITATDAYGTTATTNFQVSVNPAPTDIVKVNITASSTSSCVGAPAIFTANTANGGSNPSYQWQVNGINAGTNSATYTNSTLNDNDQITCTVTSSLSCLTNPAVTSNQIVVHILPIVSPAVSIVSSASNICAGTTVVFTTKAVNAGSSPSYQWQINGNNVGINDATFSSSTLADHDIVSCIINSNASCLAITSTVSNQISIKVKPIVIPLVTITASASTIFSGTKVTFTAIPYNGGSSPTYQWYVNGNNVGTNSLNYTSSTLKNGDIVYCTIANNSDSCVTSNSVNSNAISIIVNTNFRDMIIPTAFSPNGDGINDFWSIPALINYTDCIVDVYNRYGQLIYHSKGYSRSWDGTINGKTLSIGTYYYTISVKNNEQKLSGSIAILK